MDLFLAPVHQQVADETVPDVAGAVGEGLAALPLAEQVTPGMRVCLAVGSRGISCYTDVVRTLVEELRRLGADPFLVPAMGSHGSGTAEGQREVLVGYGMADLGAPILSSLDVVQIGATPDGMPVFWDKHAAAADAVIPINRIKAHTAFHGPFESGLFKILSIGLGKRRGAETIHAHGVATAMPAAARVVVERMPVLAGVAIVENGRHRPARVQVIPGPEIETTEPGLLELAKALQPGLPFPELDLLIIQEMGKDISGTGMDTNVVGMWRRNGGPREPDYGCVAVLDLTPNSHGNASGVGMADIIPERLRAKIDWDATYTNCRTAGNFAGAKLPMTLPTDRDVIQAGLMGKDPAQARVVYIRNTLDLETLWVSPALLPELANYPTLEQAAEVRAVEFRGKGDLVVHDHTSP